MEVRDYEESLLQALKRVEELESKYKHIREYGYPTVLKYDSIEDELKFIKGLIEANRVVIKAVQIVLELKAKK